YICNSLLDPIMSAINLDLISDQAPIRDLLVPREAEVDPVDGHGRGGTEVLPALPVDGGADELHVEADRPRDLADSEVTADGVVAVGLRENRVALEADLGVLLGIEEVGRTKMAVTLEIAGRDALDLDGDLEVA